MVELVTQTVVTTLAGAITGAVVGAVVSEVNSRRKASKGILDGMRALLWRELKNIHTEALKRGGMSIADRRHLENVYGAYHGIGGNGTGTRLYEESMNMPVID